MDEAVIVDGAVGQVFCGVVVSPAPDSVAVEDARIDGAGF